MLAKYLIPLFSLFIVCCREYPKYPDGGYAYPKNITDKDTNKYNYQLIDSFTPLEKWRDEYSYIFYRAFNEPNLSIQPQPKETFRFVYSDAFGSSMIIIFNKDSMTVKRGDPTTLYEDDTTRLSAIENMHLRLLNRRFPIDTTGEKPWAQRYLDSMVKLYPQLLDPAYYHKIYDKSRISTGEKFIPEIAKFPLTKQQYISIVQEINASGFWAMPWRIECRETMTDGYGFHLEANTKNKFQIVYVMGCPDDSTKFTKACQKIIETAKMDKKYNLIWSGEVATVDSIDVAPVELEQIKKEKKNK